MNKQTIKKAAIVARDRWAAANSAASAMRRAGLPEKLIASVETYAAKKAQQSNKFLKKVKQ